VSQFGSPAEKATVRAKVHAKFPAIGERTAKAMKDGRVSASALRKRGMKVDEE
jgi:hypothetical protein